MSVVENEEDRREREVAEKMEHEEGEERREEERDLLLKNYNDVYSLRKLFGVEEEPNEALHTLLGFQVLQPRGSARVVFMG